MKTIDVGTAPPALTELLELAAEGSVILRVPDGKEFLLAQLDDLATEVAVIREQPDLMELLSQRSEASPRRSLSEVREHLGLATEPR